MSGRLLTTQRQDLATVLLRSALMTVLGMVTLASLSCKSVSGVVDEDIDRAQAVLAGRFESVLGATSSILPDDKGRFTQPSSAAERWLSAPFISLPVSMAPLGADAWGTLHEGAKGILLGGRDFRPPDSPTVLGDVRSTGCFVVVLRQAHTLNEASLFKTATKPALPADPWAWTVEVPRDGSARVTQEVFALVVARSFVVVSMSREEVLAVAKGLTGTVVDYGAVIPDWGRLRTHEFWGYRSLRADGGTPPESSVALIPGATSVTVFLDRSTRRVVVRFSSQPGSGPPRLDAGSRLPPLVQTESGIFETSIPLDGIDVADQMFAIVSILGFGVYA